MKTKYADLIKQLERVTEAYNQAVQVAKNFKDVIDGLDDVLGVRGSVNYMDGYDINRAIHVASDCFTPAAIDCGSDFTIEDWDDYTRVECSMFGYRVFALAHKGSAEEAYLLDLAADEAKAKEKMQN